MVFFQSKRVSMVLPSRQLPPGKRRKAGLKSARIRMMSGRLPLGRSLKVGGNSETMLNQTVPLAAAESTSRFLADGADSAGVVNTAWYFVQSPAIAGITALACTVSSSVLTSSSVMGPLNSGLALA